MCLIISPVIFRLSLLLISFISSIVHTSSSLNKQLSLLSENLLKGKIISLNIFFAIFRLIPE
ncbi:hypothetical protein GPM47_002368 [Salmonella enterica]|nr:hypothetical protein [Salmonella enterica subsp. enterica serovar Bredeney]ECI3779607.1 hypothetical protein [Salmonella enterica subsp. diarizonae]ECZ9605084.1 hypothetical protein [Salmonella enterica subsp. enterica serovar Coeln]EDA5901261.1 hypothetical protein [Salmonella enterica subsp. enterica serovar Poona]EDA8239324.1 hypothetical protein [Salmonella enterica subsp. enterica serovar Reading]EDQ1732265.1 hypothetical protein [Salmonella enterica]EDT6457371.1 hypothetical protein 